LPIHTGEPHNGGTRSGPIDTAMGTERVDGRDRTCRLALWPALSTARSCLLPIVEGITQLALVVGTLPTCHPAYVTLHHLWRKPTQARIKSRINPDHNSVSCWRNRQSSPQSFQYQPCLQGIDWTQLNPHGGAIDEVPTVGAWSREYSRLLKYCDALLRCC